MVFRLFSRQRRDDLIVFIHVPKTGGTAVNHALTNLGLKGQDHIEHWLGKPDLARTKLATLDWVSGHVPYPAMRAFLSAHSPRALRFFAAVRCPMEQVASHYNWLIEIHHRGPTFYQGHPPLIQAISERIRRTDNSDPDAIIAQIKAEPSLFLNQQSRVLLGVNAARLTATDFREKLTQYDRVATENSLTDVIRHMTGKPVPVPENANKSTYHFDPAVFRSPDMQNFLNSFNKADQILYDVVSQQTTTGGDTCATHVASRT